jgi:hypothetical protein
VYLGRVRAPCRSERGGHRACRRPSALPDTSADCSPRGKKHSKSALVHSLCIVKVVRRQLFSHFRIRQDFCQVCPRATEFGDGHQLDTGKAKRGDMFESFYCALECALRRKGPDVHFVDGLRSQTLGKERRVRGR